MLCLSPGPASERIFTTPGVPPMRCEPRPAPAWPLTMSCLVSWSNHIVVLSAANSSCVSQSLARSHIQGGSVTCASQSKVGKSLVIGVNFWVGIFFLLCIGPDARLSALREKSNTCFQPGFHCIVNILRNLSISKRSHKEQRSKMRIQPRWTKPR